MRFSASDTRVSALLSHRPEKAEEDFQENVSCGFNSDCNCFSLVRFHSRYKLISIDISHCPMLLTGFLTVDAVRSCENLICHGTFRKA